MYAALRSFLDSKVEKSLEKVRGKMRKVNKYIYVFKNKKAMEYHIHINHYKEFMDCLKRHELNLKKIKIVNKRVHTGDKIDHVFNPSFTPRVDEKINQESVISTMLDEGPIKVGSLSMGGGKTFCSCYSAYLYGEKLGIQVLKRYLDKWVSDVHELYQVEEEDLMIIDSGQALNKALKMADEGELPKFKVCIFTTSVLYNYIKDYGETNFKGKPKWKVPPYKIYEALGIGFRIVDEVHQHFHQNFIVEVNTSVKKSVLLSATLISSDKFRNDLYNTLYPEKDRSTGGFMPKYTHVKSLQYPMDKATKVNYVSANGGYSHIMFEKSLQRNKAVFARYLDMLSFSVAKDFVAKDKEDSKCLVFCSLVEVCDKLVEHLKDLYPDLKIARYTSDDPYEVVIESDIIVSTLGSAGTALDIPNLLTCIMSVGLSAPQANLQAFGRLRDLNKKFGTEVTFVYFSCYHIDKHMEYERQKRVLLNPKTKSFEKEFYPVKI
tara:strand:- start:149899 stop:151371 length:1473 start_codon:yes stop_codon:yes gene_type:complete